MIERRIRAGTYPNVEELCEMFEIKQRTLYQDIRELREKLGLDIKFDRVRNGYYNATPNSGLPAFRLTDDEFILLLTGQRFIQHYGGITFASVSNSMLEKLMPDSPSIEPDCIGAYIAFGEDVNEVSFKLFADLLRACISSRQLEIETQKSPKRRVSIVPEYMLFERNGWHVCADDEAIPLRSIVSCKPL